MNAVRALPLALLMLWPPAGATPALVTTQGGVVTVQAARGGAALLRVPAVSGQDVKAERDGQAALIALSRDRDQGTTLIAVKSNGARLWKQELPGRLNRLYAHAGWFFAEYATSGAQLNVFTLVWPGWGTWTDRLPGREVARNAAALLFNLENELDPYDPVRLDFIRIEPTSARGSSRLTYTVPARQGCGSPEVDGRGGPATRFTGRYVYALRRDGCGAFAARFDWTGENPAALVYARP